MSIEMPDEVKWLLPIVVGQSWPEGDEDALRRLADAWRAAAEGVEDVTEDANGGAGQALSGMEGRTHDAFDELWKDIASGGEAALPKLREACQQLGDGCDGAALEVEHTKLTIIASLIALAIQIAAMIASAAFSFGASTAGIPIAQGITRTVVMQIFKQLVLSIAKNVAIEVATSVAIEAAVQGVQIASGERTGLDGGKFKDAAISGAIGGAVGGVFEGVGNVAARKAAGALGDAAGDAAGGAAGAAGRAAGDAAGEAAGSAAGAAGRAAGEAASAAGESAAKSIGAEAVKEGISGAAQGAIGSAAEQLITQGEIDWSEVGTGALSGGAMGAGMGAGGAALSNHFDAPDVGAAGSGDGGGGESSRSAAGSDGGDPGAGAGDSGSSGGDSGSGGSGSGDSGSASSTSAESSSSSGSDSGTGSSGGSDPGSDSGSRSRPSIEDMLSGDSGSGGSDSSASSASSGDSPGGAQHAGSDGGDAPSARAADADGGSARPAAEDGSAGADSGGGATRTDAESSSARSGSAEGAPTRSTDGDSGSTRSADAEAGSTRSEGSDAGAARSGDPDGGSTRSTDTDATTARTSDAGGSSARPSDTEAASGAGEPASSSGSGGGSARDDSGSPSAGSGAAAGGSGARGEVGSAADSGGRSGEGSGAASSRDDGADGPGSSGSGRSGSAGSGAAGSVPHGGGEASGRHQAPPGPARTESASNAGAPARPAEPVIGPAAQPAPARSDQTATGGGVAGAPASGAPGGAGTAGSGGGRPGAGGGWTGTSGSPGSAHRPLGGENARPSTPRPERSPSAAARPDAPAARGPVDGPARPATSPQPGGRHAPHADPAGSGGRHHSPDGPRAEVPGQRPDADRPTTDAARAPQDRPHDAPPRDTERRPGADRPHDADRTHDTDQSPGTERHDDPASDRDAEPGTPERQHQIDQAEATRERTPGGSSYHHDPAMRDLAQRVPSDGVHHTVDAHALPDGRVRIGDRTFSAGEFADVLRRDPNWDGGPVRLLSCDAGSSGLARELARELGVPVTAPRGLAWTDGSGRVFATDLGPDGRPGWPPNGGWDTHHPDGTDTPASADGFHPSRDGEDPGAAPEDAESRGRQYPSPEELDWQRPHYTRQETVTAPPNERSPLLVQQALADRDPTAPRPDLLPKTRYAVVDDPAPTNRPPRVTYLYTNDEIPARITHVHAETPNHRIGRSPNAELGNHDIDGKPVTPTTPESIQNPDAQHLTPDIAYQVDTGDGLFTFETNENGHPVLDLDEFDSPPVADDEFDDAADSPDAVTPVDRVWDLDQHGPFSNVDRKNLDPNTAYRLYTQDGSGNLKWHGDFYTNGDSPPRFTHISTWTGAGTSQLNPELGDKNTMQDIANTRPDGLPINGVKYEVDGTHFHVDEHGNGSLAFTTDYSQSGSSRGNQDAQRRIGHIYQEHIGETGRGGHGKDHRNSPHPPMERINITPQAYVQNNFTGSQHQKDLSWRRMEYDGMLMGQQFKTDIHRRIWYEAATVGDVPDRAHVLWEQVTNGVRTVHYRSFDNVPNPAPARRPGAL
ncbi:hypothetical protein ACL03H_13495 [Saccharopolyspora sp. MS10]|uniref:WXG100-like domain-containing protein n=1 Tax=Saccharopolyspora sp. MS10 TaxID=3385973 RepID=UPI00399FE063